MNCSQNSKDRPRLHLPIDNVLPEFRDAFFSSSVVIVEAEPGAGKTTRIPPELLNLVEGEIVVLEPRRLAAKMSAERVAFEKGERTGDSVGYQVRFESSVGPNTRLCFYTEGLFLRKFVSDPDLKKVGCVVLDEYHERHLHTDISCGLVRWLQKNVRPDLKLIVMSATLNLSLLRNAIPEAAVVSCKGRAFPVEIEYLPAEKKLDLEFLVEDAVKELSSDPRCAGDILVFLPGASEIRRCAAQIQSFCAANNIVLLELRADLSSEQQQRVFEPSSRRRIVLSTNVAETSLTIDGITGVIDSGLAKIAGYAVWSGLSTLETRKISQASANQRAGRAGRTAPGVTILVLGLTNLKFTGLIWYRVSLRWKRFGKRC
jgi:ATP-dependent helicase HrpB